MYKFCLNHPVNVTLSIYIIMGKEEEFMEDKVITISILRLKWENLELFEQRDSVLIQAIVIVLKYDLNDKDYVFNLY